MDITRIQEFIARTWRYSLLFQTKESALVARLNEIADLLEKEDSEGATKEEKRQGELLVAFELRTMAKSFS